MAQISVRIDSKKVMIGLRKFGDAIPDIVGATVEGDYAERVLKAISGQYRGGSSYGVALPASGKNVRTGNYGRSVTYVREGMTYRFLNNAYSRRGYNYGVKLTGDGNGQNQKWWAAGRWPIAKIEVEKETESLVRELDESLKNGIEAAGL